MKDFLNRLKEEPVRWSALFALMGAAIGAGGASFSVASFAWRQAARHATHDIHRAVAVQTLLDHQQEHTQQIDEILSNQRRTRRLLLHMELVLDRIAHQDNISTADSR
jgi:hypothetical protein